MKLFAAVLAAAAIGAANAECPNACSGHGVCGTNDACTCYDNWMGGDCSQRVCSFGLAFVDTPVGDLNHDGSVAQATSVKDGRGNAAFSESYKTVVANDGHFYTECSGKGSCDRSSGLCTCFDGYTGGACQRTTCPNDCSGKGQCLSLREIAAGTNSGAPTAGRNYRVTDESYGVTTGAGVSAKFDYNLWDADKNQACVCDKGYFGPDCAMRACPKGDDPLTVDSKHCGGACTSEIQYIELEDIGAADAGYRMYLEWTDGEEYSGLLSTLRSSIFTMRTGQTCDQNADLFQDVLETFPDGVLNGVTVSCALTDATTHATAMADNGEQLLKVDFTNGPSGNVAKLVAKAAEVVNTATTHAVSVSISDETGATALAQGILEDASGAAGVTDAGIGGGGGTIVTAQSGAAKDGNRENAVCSNRGVCDFSTGECQCFSGYTREDCSKQAALAM